MMGDQNDKQRSCIWWFMDVGERGSITCEIVLLRALPLRRPNIGARRAKASGHHLCPQTTTYLGIFYAKLRKKELAQHAAVRLPGVEHSEGPPKSWWISRNQAREAHGRPAPMPTARVRHAAVMAARAGQARWLKSPAPGDSGEAAWKAGASQRR